MPKYDIVIVGGGCVGCSTAKHLAEDRELDIALVEKEHRLAAHQSGRNSGVLHPGFNYEPGSTKARFATEGTTRMKAYANERDIPLREFGVVVVATTAAEERRLSSIQQQADANGVETEIIGSEELEEREPHAQGRAALYCPEAASVDSQQYVYELAKEAKNAGVDFYMGHTVESVSASSSDVRVRTDKGTINGDYFVNAAGLYADKLAAEVGVGTGYQIIPFRGDYYELVPERRHLCNTMIYPTPDPELPFLGVHYTRRTDGKVIVGPNAVLAFAREAYRNTEFDLGELRDVLSYGGFWKLMMEPKMMKVAWEELNKSYKKKAFVKASRNLVPEARAQDFVRSYAGVRAQLVDGNGELVKDPMVQDGPRSLHVLNAVSPGLTCSLPFGEHVAEQVREEL
ncbi:L-2-hydroxyglutarate oxidase [Natrinema sp. LN54]|uniref:L-2-hydroxyglutarate oxidase n=1 Tax=Natrinema sp. LN54 TaxID=3458705 RepID=UPI0040374DB8